jgi:transposase
VSTENQECMPMARTKPWELSDEVWERSRLLLPARKPHPRGGRPPRDDRQMLGAMLYVLRTGLQWNALPCAIGASTTVYDRFRAWEADGFFGRLWAAGLAEFDELVGIDWEWQSLDGALTKAPFCRAATATAEGIGPNPTDRGKHGTKRSTLSEGHGLPLAVVVAGANVPDMKLAAPTLDALVLARPEPTAERPQHLCLCLDKGYDYDLPRFAARDCSPCLARQLCTHAAKLPRTLAVRTEQAFLALQRARQRQQTPGFKQVYAKRAGIEGTLSQGVRAFELRRSRYVGDAKTRLQHLLIASALNIVRLFAWRVERPREPTRRSCFAALAPLPLAAAAG